VGVSAVWLVTSYTQTRQEKTTCNVSIGNLHAQITHVFLAVMYVTESMIVQITVMRMIVLMSVTWQILQIVSVIATHLTTVLVEWHTISAHLEGAYR